MKQTVEQFTQLFKREAAGLTGKAVDLKDHTIYYEVQTNSENTERTFILTHGACGTGRFMNPIAIEIINTIPNSKVIVLDLPFHGYSIPSVRVEDYDILVYGDVVSELLEKLKEENEITGIAHWIGWSMGGSLGLLSALNDSTIEELTVLNSSPIWESVVGLLEAVPPLKDENAIVEVFKGIVASQVTIGTDDEVAEAILNSYHDITPTGKVMVRDFAGLTPDIYNVVGRLPEITAKTLVVGGTKDPVADVKYQHVMAETIPNAELILLEDDHCMLVKPHAVEVIVKEIKERFFLKG